MGNTFSNLIFFALLLLSCFCSQFGTATASDVISPSKSIKDPEFIISEGGVFRLGFFGFPNSNNRYVGIWYNQIPEQTVVWVANGNNPLSDSSGVLKISADGNLVVLNRQGEILWTSNVSNPVSNTTAQLLDSGNLVLNDGFIIIWESFQHPSNALLPTMKLTTNLRTGQKVQLRSWKSPFDPSDGNFSVSLEPLNIPELMIWNNDQQYLRSGPWNGRMFTDISAPSYYRDGLSLAIDDKEGTYSISYTFSNKSLLVYDELNSQGTITQRIWDAGKGNWDDKIIIYPTDCGVYGKCGEFGVCDPMKPSICSCLRGFEPKNREDWRSGCARTTKLQCPEVNNGSKVGKEDGFLKVEKVKVPAFPEWSPTEKVNCKDQCLKNCSCVAYAVDADIGCMLWSRNLIDIRKFDDGGTDLYIRVASSELEEGKDMTIIISVLASIGGIIMVIFFTLLWCWTTGRKQKSRWNLGKTLATFSRGIMVGENSIEVKLQQLPLFKFDELATATNNFHSTKMLGRGGFGQVYKGTLQDGNEIAVKRLSRASSQGLEEFMNEVVVISKLQHRNLVRLLGCCVEGEEKMLVYEYMPNKSLDAFLFDPIKQEFLDWKKRFNIIQGIGRGVLYLHRDSRLRIVHRDLKASNVLLDQQLNPKISDFGMARIFGANEVQANTKRIVGTYGYMSQEYAMQGQFSEKSDIFSFGVLLLEIVSGRKNTSFYDNQHTFNLLGYAWKLWTEDSILGLIEMGVNYESSYDVKKEILRCIHVGLLCVQEFANDRPTMSTVVSMLNSEIVDLPLPKQPAFVEVTIQEANESFMKTTDTFSVNEVSITMEFDGR